LEELENDKIIYWILFFIILVVIAVFGHYYVFSYAEEKKKENEQAIINNQVDIDDYMGVWQLFGDDELPLQELSINILDGSTITFDYFINEVAYFDSQTASLDKDTANFEINDRENSGMAKGKIIFQNNKIYLVVTLTNIVDINPGTYVFVDRSQESLLD